MSAIGAFLAGNRVVILTLCGAAVILAGMWLLRDYGKTKETAGAAKVTTAVQADSIKRSEEARQDKVRVDDAVRAKPIDAVIDEDLK